MMIPKNPPLRDRRYLDAVRDMPCVLTYCASSEVISVVPAHIRHGLSGGTGLKPSDDLVLPLRSDLHDEQHRVGEVRFWREHVTDELLMRALKALARQMYEEWKR